MYFMRAICPVHFDLLPSSLLTKVLYVFVMSLIRATCPIHPILHELFVLIFREGYRLWSSSLCSILQPTSAVWRPNIYSILQPTSAVLSPNIFSILQPTSAVLSPNIFSILQPISTVLRPNIFSILQPTSAVLSPSIFLSTHNFNLRSSLSMRKMVMTPWSNCV